MRAAFFRERGEKRQTQCCFLQAARKAGLSGIRKTPDLTGGSGLLHQTQGQARGRDLQRSQQQADSSWTPEPGRPARGGGVVGFCAARGPPLGGGGRGGLFAACRPAVVPALGEEERREPSSASADRRSGPPILYLANLNARKTISTQLPARQSAPEPLREPVTFAQQAGRQWMDMDKARLRRGTFSFFLFQETGG